MRAALTALATTQKPAYLDDMRWLEAAVWPLMMSAPNATRQHDVFSCHEAARFGADAAGFPVRRGGSEVVGGVWDEAETLRAGDVENLPRRVHRKCKAPPAAADARRELLLEGWGGVGGGAGEAGLGGGAGVMPPALAAVACVPPACVRVMPLFSVSFSGGPTAGADMEVQQGSSSSSHQLQQQSSSPALRLVTAYEATKVFIDAATSCTVDTTNSTTPAAIRTAAAAAALPTLFNYTSILRFPRHRSPCPPTPTVAVPQYHDRFPNRLHTYY